MADPALPQRAPARAAASLRDTLAQFVEHATKPFSGPGLPNWYIFSTFVLLLICMLSVLLNILLLGLFLIAAYG